MSLRGATLQAVINLGEGVTTSQILARLWLKYGSVLSFNDLMKAYLNVAHKSYELVTGYVVRLERDQSRLQTKYNQRIDQNSKAQHKTDRLY